MTRLCSAVAPWLVYPAVIVGAVAAHWLLLWTGWPVVASVYLPVLLAAAAVTLLEQVMPYRRDWSPSKQDVRTDFIYMAVVQLALPKLLGITVGLFVLHTVQNVGWITSSWPSTLPLPAQLALFILGSSFVRYWTHRAGHEWSLLWRVHAVHHSPKNLYWLNLGRFHPGEELIRFGTETLPAIVLGVPEAVLYLYFVVLATNGFLSHCNIQLKHGPLNYVFATAELHRWHHARDRRISACNYGNLLIIWDIEFGTFYLPARRSVGELGLINRCYPRSFFGQLLAPLVPDLDKRTPVPVDPVRLRTQGGVRDRGEAA